MHNPLVSVIIPNYCHARYLDQRIQSVLNQTYQNFEVIILDDCSPDDGASRAVIEKYRDNPHVSHIVYNTENSGSTFRQWNKGFGLAKGELIWIAESDDYCEKDLMEKLIQPFLYKKQCSISFCRTVLVDEQGNMQSAGPPNLNSGIYDGGSFIRDFMSIGNSIVNASSVLFSKECLQSISGDYQLFQGAGDRLFWIYLSECGYVSFTDDRLNYCRQHPVNTTKDKNKKGINQKEDKKILDYILKKGYITPSEYKKNRKIYVRVMIFEMIEDKDLKKTLYSYWNFSTFEQIQLRIEAWIKKINTILCR